MYLWEEGRGGGGWFDFVVIEELLHLPHENECLLRLALDRLQDGCAAGKRPSHIKMADLVVT